MFFMLKIIAERIHFIIKYWQNNHIILKAFKIF